MGEEPGGQMKINLQHLVCDNICGELTALTSICDE